MNEDGNSILQRLQKGSYKGTEAHYLAYTAEREPDEDKRRTQDSNKLEGHVNIDRRNCKQVTRQAEEMDRPLWVIFKTSIGRKDIVNIIKE